jgi:hypothetical protein
MHPGTIGSLRVACKVIKMAVDGRKCDIRDKTATYSDRIG